MIKTEPASFEADQIRQWLSEVCEQLTIAPTVLARRARLSPSTINRFVGGKSVNKNLSLSTIQALEQAIAEVAAEKQLATDGRVTRQRLPLFYRAKLSERYSIVTVTSTIGWEIVQNSFQWPQDEWYEVMVPLQRSHYSKYELVGFEFREERNGYYADESIIVGVDFKDIDYKLRGGERLIILSGYENTPTYSGVYECVVGKNELAWLIPTANDAREKDEGRVYRVEADRRTIEATGRHFFLILASIQPDIAALV